MTKMSEPDGVTSGPAASNTSQPQGGFPLARGVHSLRSPVVRLACLLCLGPALTGCIIPPSLSSESEEDRVNSPPAIIAVRTDADNLFEPGPVSLTRNSGTINFELLDTDLGDTLVVRVFINYVISDPTPARAQCTAPPTDMVTRTVTCTAGAICQMADDGQTRNMTIVVFDRPLLESGTPEFQAMADEGRSTSRFFFANCMGPQS